MVLDYHRALGRFEALSPRERVIKESIIHLKGLR